MKAYGSINPPEPVAVGPAFALEPRRWLMLAYLSTFALLSDWVCFFSAPIPELVVRTYSNDAFAVSNSHLVTVFLATNVLFCFLEPVVVRDARDARRRSSSSSSSSRRAPPLSLIHI